MAGEHVKVVLTGEGADEIFAGYRKFLVESAAVKYQSLPPHQQREMEAAYPELKAYLRVRHDDPVKRYIQTELLFHPDELSVLLGKDIERGRFSGRCKTSVFRERASPELCYSNGNPCPIT